MANGLTADEQKRLAFVKRLTNAFHADLDETRTAHMSEAERERRQPKTPEFYADALERRLKNGPEKFEPTPELLALLERQKTERQDREKAA